MLLMASPKILDVQCLLCKEIIKCKQDDTSILLDHAKLEHPDYKITNIPKEFILPNKQTNRNPGKHLKKAMEEDRLLYDCDGNCIPQYPRKKAATKRRKFYKTSVEKWKPGRDKILCPKCNAIVRPVIRTSADRVSHSTIGAALIMTCWPFCFFPFLFPAPIQENLHCSICGFYFGSYDYQKQAMNVPKETQQRKTEQTKTEDTKMEAQQRKSIDTKTEAQRKSADTKTEAQQRKSVDPKSESQQQKSVDPKTEVQQRKSADNKTETTTTENVDTAAGLVGK